MVSYQGQLYKCLQAHTSLPGREPPKVPILWKVVGAASTTPTLTSASTPTPTVTPTPTSTLTPYQLQILMSM